MFEKIILAASLLLGSASPDTEIKAGGLTFTTVENFSATRGKISEELRLNNDGFLVARCSDEKLLFIRRFTDVDSGEIYFKVFAESLNGGPWDDAASDEMLPKSKLRDWVINQCQLMS